MIRLFEQHFVREQKELDGMWSYVREDGAEYTLPVPGCIEQHPELLTYRGKGTYYKKVFIKEKTNVRLEFKGVSHTADVYFDNEFLVHHYNAFTGFSGIVEGVEPGEHEIKVCVDNSFSEASALHVPNDYYTYGGIMRPVVMEQIGNVYIKNVHFTPDKSEGIWNGKIEVEVENVSDKDIPVEVRIELARTEMTEMFHAGARSCGQVTFQVKCENAEEWNTDSPRLYLLHTNLLLDGKIVDDYIDRVGFRTISMTKQRLLINGKPVFLKGFNRHEDYGTIGSAIPLQVMVQDMDLMQETGANAVRTCHYPNDERFLDLCDERGMMVWEENHARGLSLEQMCNPNFDRQCRDCIDEMISQHYNHPAIVIWGILNECDSTSETGREKYKNQYEQIKRLDSSRPTTSATCKHFQDICLDLLDIVSFNMYSGWYQDVPVKDRHEQEMDWIAQTGGAGKPVIVSEFGAAAMYGYRDRGRCKWSEERQADIIRENLEVYREDERITGVFIWQFADCKVTEEEWFFSRARCHNNKGVVDEYRRPKEAFDVVKQLFPQMNGKEK
ncbi:MAG: beta-glucuronidase [Lachnospiraceae bacterium]|nr:beta-glucuronidase [Lachnospiraceae bacterium]